MKKSLILIPLAALLVVGCTSGGTKKKSKKSTSTTSAKSTSTSQGKSSESTSLPPQDPPSFGPEEVQGYKRVESKPVADKDYLLGFYHVNQNKVLFMNGGPHTDTVKDPDTGVEEEKEFPFYQKTTEDVSKAVKLRVEFDTDNTKYAIKIVGEGEETAFDGKYFKIVEGENSFHKLASIDHVDEAVYQFTYQDVESNYNVKTNVATYETTGSSSGVAVMACSEAQYTTISAVEPRNYKKCYVAHFYEKVASTEA